MKLIQLIQLRQVVEKNTVNQQKVRQLRRATKKYKNTPIINHCCNDYYLEAVSQLLRFDPHIICPMCVNNDVKMEIS